jgi:phosphoglycolate phosphatase
LELVIFDCDGVLVDSERIALRVDRTAFAELGWELDDAEIVERFMGRSDADAHAEIAAHLGHPVPSDWHATVQQRYRAALEAELAPVPGVVEALDALEAAGFRLAVCTNKYEGQSVELLRILGIGDRFAAICGRDTFPQFKPDPRHLTDTIARAGGDPARAVMVGDSRTDIDTAKAAGIPVVAVTFGYTDRPVTELGPDRVIEHFSQLPEAVGALVPVDA